MSFEAFRRGIQSEIFDYQTIASYYSELKKVRDKVSSLIEEGKIIRIRKGLYVFGEAY